MVLWEQYGSTAKLMIKILPLMTYTLILAQPTGKRPKAKSGPEIWRFMRRIPFGRETVSILLKALEQIKSSENDLYFVFTVQEEVGVRGAKTAAYGVAPDYGIALDVTIAADTPGAKKISSVVMGGGAAIKVMDNSLIAHPAMVEMLEELGQKKEIKTQLEVLTAGGTDAGAIHQSRTGVVTGAISIPCRYVHTPMEMADLSDIESCIALVTAFAESKLK